MNAKKLVASGGQPCPCCGVLDNRFRPPFSGGPGWLFWSVHSEPTDHQPRDPKADNCPSPTTLPLPTEKDPSQ